MAMAKTKTMRTLKQGTNLHLSAATSRRQQASDLISLALLALGLALMLPACRHHEPRVARAEVVPFQQVLQQQTKQQPASSPLGSIKINHVNISESGARGEGTSGRDDDAKITIIVREEDPISANGSAVSVGTTSRAETAGAAPAHARPVPRYRVDATVRVIHADQDKEAGVLWAELNETSQEKHAPARLREPIEGGGSGSTNFSVFLISRHKAHIAILIDIEEIDFEPIINCEYQELKFSIVGEISRQLLDRRNGSQLAPSTEADGENQLTEANEAAEGASEWAPSPADDAHAEAPTSPPLPVSEAMALLLNAPLNKTLLDASGELNDFRLIDATIDYLHEETCRELQSAPAKPTGQPANVSEPSGPLKGRRRRRKHRSRPKRRQKQTDKGCDQEGAEFRKLLAVKLNDYLEWDDFKIVCGKTRQLVIPMRSLKLSVSSDEFSPASKFAIRYRFLSDASQLPALDNGKYFCRNRNVIDAELRCDGYDDCGDASDESVKICGYPSGRSATGNELSLIRDRSGRGGRASASETAGSGGGGAHHRQGLKLTYFNGDVLHCCRSSDWQNAVSQKQAVNLQTLIGDSMHLFSGPLFAPTREQSGRARHRSGRFKRIVGGTEAHRGSWPGQASLQYELLEPLCHFCAGTLIHPQYVLTAGHCITKDGLTRGIKVVFGAHDLRLVNGSEIQTRYVDDAQIYPGVDVKHLSFEWENDMNNDLALLRLNAPVLITPHVAPACLPPFNTPLAVNTSCRSIGWGQTHGSGSSNLLKHLKLRVVDSAECSKELLDRDGDANDNSQQSGRSPSPSAASERGRPAGDFESSGLDVYSNQTMVCVNNDQGHGICQGDSGGPLYCDRVSPSGEHCTEIYGVASFIIQYATVGAMCAVENLPGIFGEVSSKTEWISSTVKMFEQSYRLKYAHAVRS